MRLIAKQNDRFLEIFRVNFYGKKGLSVIGEFLLFKHLEPLIPTGINFHSHFIYSENGNYHFSIKYFDTAENLYVDRKTFYNHIAIRKGNSPEFSDEQPYERRDKIPDDPLDMFMMSVPLKPWTERPLAHPFGTTSIPATPNQLKEIENNANINLQEGDLVIDFNEYKNMNINFGATLYSKDNPAFDFSKLRPDYILKKISIEKNDLILCLHAFIIPP
jgi:hypothetical protein